jgi:predicted TIM-barrel fold metal-dependent hydrolase
MRIIDAHHHIWRQADLPWLQGPTQPRIFGSYDPIKRDYPIEEYLSDIAGTGVEKSVYVQANWAPDRGQDEAEWVQATADRTGWPHGIVAYCDMTVPDARTVLDRLAQLPLLRGIRQQFHWHEQQLYRFARHPDLCRDPNVQRNVDLLADYGLAFDLQVFAGQMDGAAELARACPNVTFVLQHSGMLEDLSDDGRTTWKAQMRKLAAEPNVTSKLSAFGTFIHRNDPAHIERILHDTLAIFGAERCLFGSNFPIEKIWTGYRDLIEAFLKAAGDLSAADRRAIFHDTAARVYRL